MHGTLGLKLSMMLVSVFFGLKGVLDSLTIEALLPLFRELNYDGVAYQRTLAMALTPYALKGFIGSISDYFPIGGYHKKYYMMGSNLVGLGCAVALVALPESIKSSSIMYVGLLYCGIHLHISTADLLCEGVYCKVVQAHPAVGAKLVAFLSFCNSTGHLVGKTLVGPISDAFGTAPLLYMTVPLVLQTLAPISFNFLGETKGGVREAGGAFTRDKSHRGVFTVAVLTSISACIALVLTLQTWRGWAVVFTVFVVLLLGGASCYLLSRRLALCAMFFFADRVLHLTISGAVNFYYIAPPSCVPDGPNFDYTYFCTYTALVGAIGCWSGIYAFQKWFKGWSARTIFWLTNTVRILAALFDYVIVRRLNIRIGIPDKVMFMLGDAIVYHLLLTLSCMTSSLTVARSCPPKLESTVYAIVSGVTNLGSTCSKMLGAVAIEIAGIQMKETAPGGCDFHTLPNLILVSQCLLPCACIPLAYFMLPKEALNSAVPPHQRRRSKTACKGSSNDQSKTPCNPPQGSPTAEPPCDAASETLALQESVGGDKEEVAVVAGDAGSRPRIVEV